MVYKFGVATNEDKVINIKYKFEKTIIQSLGIDIKFNVSPIKSRIMKEPIHFFISNSRR